MGTLCGIIAILCRGSDPNEGIEEGADVVLLLLKAASEVEYVVENAIWALGNICDYRK